VESLKTDIAQKAFWLRSQFGSRAFFWLEPFWLMPFWLKLRVRGGFARHNYSLGKAGALLAYHRCAQPNMAVLSLTWARSRTLEDALETCCLDLGSLYGRAPAGKMPIGRAAFAALAVDVLHRGEFPMLLSPQRRLSSLCARQLKDLRAGLSSTAGKGLCCGPRRGCSSADLCRCGPILPAVSTGASSGDVLLTGGQSSEDIGEGAPSPRHEDPAHEAAPLYWRVRRSASGMCRSATVTSSSLGTLPRPPNRGEHGCKQPHLHSKLLLLG